MNSKLVEEVLKASYDCDVLASEHRSIAANLYARSRYLERKGIAKASSIRSAAKTHLIKATRLSRHADQLAARIQSFV
jgi:bacterioferritin (cytochrome b1)